MIIKKSSRCLLRTWKNLNLTKSCRTQSVWTQDNIVKSPYKEIEVPNCTLVDYIWENLDKWPDRTASVCGVTGRGYTFAQAFNMSNTFAANLRQKFGIRDGDTVAVMLPNIPDYPLVVLGALEAGAIVTTVNPIYTAHEVQRILLMSEAKVVVTLPGLVDLIKEAFNLAKINIPIVTIKTTDEPTPEGTAVFSELTDDVHVDKSCLRQVRRNAKDISLLPYSSGTTGLPKGVELTNTNIVANCLQQCAQGINHTADTTANHQDSVLAILPLYHIYAMTVVMFHKLAQGVKIVTLPKFQPDSFLNALVKYKISTLYTAPPNILFLGSHPGVKPEHFEHLRTIMSGAAPLASPDIQRLRAKLKGSAQFIQGYGATETSPITTIMELGDTKYTSVGKPVSNTELKITNDKLTVLGPNEVGELLVRGPQVMKGYRNNPEATAESITADGWYRTGDLATIDEEGSLTIADRLKELIKVKGFQVPPAELESVLKEHPSVFDAAVIGISHPKSGEVPKAFIQVVEGTNPDLKEIQDFVAKRVAPFKKIHEIVVIDAIPKNPAGKILRKKLKEQYY